ncbi:FAD-dependent oxidoreductase [Streptomyces sp. CWNU-52B]|uniref:FAD-dependent oxidoreductase n=1 Tax=unclassified Streptomyces TaxID=2593676 RepID=UPI0039C17B45
MVTDTGRGAPTVGLLGYAGHPELDLRCVIHGPGLDVRPAGGGRTVLQALDLNADVDAADPPPAGGAVASTLARRFSELLPDGSRAPRIAPHIELRVGLRSLPADGLPVVGYAAGHARVYCLVSHSGITLAAVLGRLAATEITGDRSQDLLAAFRPTRFTGVRRTALGHRGGPAGRPARRAMSDEL